MKHNAMALWEILVVVGIVAILAAILWPVVAPRSPHYSSGRVTCQANLKQIGLGFAQYLSDYDDNFPLSSRPEGWVGALQPYVKSDAAFRCPTEKRQTEKTVLASYWFNRRLAGVENKEIADASLTLLGGDGEASDDPNVSLQLLPPLWVEKKDSPARRHLDYGNYLFADGHTKALKPEKITVEKPGQAFTFLAR